MLNRIGNMGVHKASSKVAKKVSKLDSLKNLVFGTSNSSPKKPASHTKAAPAQPKKGSADAKAQSNASVKTGGVPTSKSGGKSKVSSQAVSSSKSANDIKQSGKSAAAVSAALSKRLNAHSGSRLEAMGESVCREVACEGLATSSGYCRLHYIKNWKKIKRKEMILREKKLNQYIEELVVKYPDKYIEAIRQDLASDKDFAKVIYDLDLDEGVDDFDIEGGESVDSLIDTIKRDFDDEGESY